MRKYRRSIWESRFGSVMLSAFLGVAAVVVGLAVSALVLYIMGDIRYRGLFAKVVTAIGAFFGSYICGKHYRRHGAANGALCGLVMYLVIAACGFVVTGSFCGLKKLLLLAVSGVTGGITSVARKTSFHVNTHLKF